MLICEQELNIDTFSAVVHMLRSRELVLAMPSHVKYRIHTVNICDVKGL